MLQEWLIRLAAFSEVVRQSGHITAAGHPGVVNPKITLPFFDKIPGRVIFTGNSLGGTDC